MSAVVVQVKPPFDWSFSGVMKMWFKREISRVNLYSLAVNSIDFRLLPSHQLDGTLAMLYQRLCLYMGMAWMMITNDP